MTTPAKLKIFKNFLYLAWKHLQLPEPTEIQYQMADYLHRPERKWTLRHAAEQMR